MRIPKLLERVFCRKAIATMEAAVDKMVEEERRAGDLAVELSRARKLLDDANATIASKDASIKMLREGHRDMLRTVAEARRYAPIVRVQPGRDSHARSAVMSVEVDERLLQYCNDVDTFFRLAAEDLVAQLREFFRENGVIR